MKGMWRKDVKPKFFFNNIIKIHVLTLEAGLQGCLARMHFEFLVFCINLTGRKFILQICTLLAVPFAASS